ncbi:MAG: hypothetical protein ACJAYU_000561 [Bradymonadia bacterium]
MNYANQLIALVCLLGPVSALSQDTIPIPHISPMNQRELTEMADRAKSGLFRVHAISIPDGLFQPIPIEADGLAVWLKVGENPPALVTTYAYISAAQTVELLIGTEWVQAQVVYGSPLFDLAMLQVEVEPPVEDALPLVDSWPLEATVYVPLATSDSTVPSEVVHGMLGGRALPDMLSYYTRAHFWQRNGYPVVSRQGEVMAITSIYSPDGQGVLAVPFNHIATWQQEWGTLDPENPYDHQPEVRVERIDPVINGGARSADDDPTLPPGAMRGTFEN